MNSLTRRSTSARVSLGTVTRTDVSPSSAEKSSTSNGRSSEINGTGAAGAPVSDSLGVDGDAGAGVVVAWEGGPFTERAGSFGGYLSRTGDASRPTNFGGDGVRAFRGGGRERAGFFRAMIRCPEAPRPISRWTRDRRSVRRDRPDRRPLDFEKNVPGYSSVVARNTVRISVTVPESCSVLDDRRIK